MRRLFLIIGLLGLLVGCGGAEETAVPTPTETSSSTGMGMGQGGSMMARHNAPIPADYAGLTNPQEADDASIERGMEIYTTYCATCHGDGGMGDGPAAANLDPVPAPIAHTSRMLGDDYLFWRVSEGGMMEPFNSVMPSWAAGLEVQQRWDVINYVRALSSGDMPGGMGMGQGMGQGMGGAQFDPAAEAAQQAEMLAQAVEQDVITQAEADVFSDVHALLDSQMTETMQQMQGNMSQMREVLLAQLVDLGTVSAEDAATFNDVHDRLMAAGLMQ